VKVYGANGQLVDTMNLGPQAAGHVGFSWDGDGATGEGVYRITAETNIDGQARQLGTLVWNPVQSVAVGQNGQNANLRIDGLGNVDMNAVREIR
jgi:flagellar hook assembly protein FlgD